MSKAELFIDQHRDSIAEYVDIFGVDPNLVDDLEKLVEQTQPWVKGDHARPEHRIGDMASATMQKLDAIHDELGLRRRLDIEEGVYEQAVILGGMHRGNTRRTRFLREQLDNPNISIGRVVALGGERGVYSEIERSQIEFDLARLGLVQTADSLVSAGGKMVGVELIENETDMLRLAIALELGNFSLKQESLERLDFENENPAGMQDLTILHTAAVDRENGNRRHTTEACIKDWVAEFDQSISRGAKIPLIATNPHIMRAVRSAQRIADKEGSSVEFVPVGPAGLDCSYELFRGEVARLLFEDRLAL